MLPFKRKQDKGEDVSQQIGGCVEKKTRKMYFLFDISKIYETSAKYLLKKTSTFLVLNLQGLAKRFQKGNTSMLSR